jgi:putative transposase
MNAICERLIGTLRREVMDRTLILNQAHLRSVLAEYQEHYNTARPIRASASASQTVTQLPASRSRSRHVSGPSKTGPGRPHQRI